MEQVDSSSGAIGTAVNNAIDALVQIVAKAPADKKVRDRWLKRLWKAVEEDGIFANHRGMGRRIQKKEVKMKCVLCKGNMIEGKTNLPFETARENMVVVKGVPALVCSQCGEPFIEIQVLRHVEEIVDSAEKNGVTLGFVQYRKAA